MGALFARFWCTCGPLQKNLMVSNFEADAIFNDSQNGVVAFQPHVKEKPGFWYRIFLIYDCKKRKEKKKRERNKKKMN